MSWSRLSPRGRLCRFSSWSSYLKCTRRYNKSVTKSCKKRERWKLSNHGQEASGNKKRHNTVNFRFALFPTRKMFPRPRCALLTKKRSNLFRYFKLLLLWSILRKWNSRESSCALNLTAMFASESLTLSNYKCYYFV